MHLRYGVEDEKRIQQQRAHWDEGIGHKEWEMFEAFLTLPAPQRKIVREVIQTFAKDFPAETIRKKSTRD